MTEYFNYLRKMLERFFSDLGRFFNKAFACPWADVPGNVGYYNSLLKEYSTTANSTGQAFWFWLFYVIFLLLLIGLIGAALFGLFLLLRNVYFISIIN